MGEDQTSEGKRQKKGIDQGEWASLSKASRNESRPGCQRKGLWERQGDREAEEDKSRGKRSDPLHAGFNGLAQQLRVLVGGLRMDRSILFSGSKTFELLRKTVWRMKETIEDTKGRRVSQRKTRCNKVERGPKRENRQGGGVIGIILVMQFDHAEWRGWRTRRVCRTGAREDLHERRILEVKKPAWIQSISCQHTTARAHREKLRLYTVLQSLTRGGGVDPMVSYSYLWNSYECRFLRAWM